MQLASMHSISSAHHSQERPGGWQYAAHPVVLTMITLAQVIAQITRLISRKPRYVTKSHPHHFLIGENKPFRTDQFSIFFINHIEFRAIKVHTAGATE